jgi:hypothetical protein
MNKPTRVVHPFLFAIFPALFLYAENISETFYTDFAVSIIVMSVLNICMWLMISIFIKSRKRSGLILSCLILSSFAYSNFATFLISLFHLDIDRYSIFLVIAWFILVVIAIWIISRLKASLTNWTKVLNIVAICLISLSLVKIIPNIPEKISVYKSRNAYSNSNEFPKPDTIPETLPNIYYLVLDEHVGFPTMERFGFDTSVLKEALGEKGFFLAEESRSNYPWTSLAMPSTLNFRYLELPSSKSAFSKKDHGPLHFLMDNNRVFQFLKSYEYTTIQCSTSPRNHITAIESADKVLTHYPWYYSGFSLELFSNTPYYPLLTVLIAKEGEKGYTPKEVLRKRQIEKSFEEIKNVTSHKGPFILYAHVMCPHAPFIYDENGQRPNDENKFSGVHVESYPPELQDDLRKYFAQMTYLQKKILDIIDHIKKHSEEPPIIIVQGDHGIRNMLVQRQKAGQTDIPQDVFPELFSVLNAFHLPGFDYSQLPNDITSVNTFRIIFNHYFKTDFAILPNRYFFSFPKRSLDFQEVTDLVDLHKGQIGYDGQN